MQQLIDASKWPILLYKRLRQVVALLCKKRFFIFTFQQNNSQGRFRCAASTVLLAERAGGGGSTKWADWLLENLDDEALRNFSDKF